MMTLLEAAIAVSGTPIGSNGPFTSVSTDSRSVPPGALFVALRGERFDGHDFLDKAREAGAAAAMVDAASRSGAEAAPLPLIVVPDTLAALGALAAAWRRPHHPALIGVVGSNGKTTVKEMIAAILRAEFGAEHVLATEGNFNNAIGLALTLLKLRNTHRAAVIELGMNHPGETAELAAIARPGIGLVNNAQREHQEFMKSVADVAAEHAALLDALPRGGVAVLNADDPFAGVWHAAADRAGAAVRDFGIDGSARVSARLSKDRGQSFASDIVLDTPEGEAHFTLHLPGLHNVRNAAAAAAAATAAGATLASVERGLSDFAGVKGRQQRKQGTGGAVVIDDTYNANPESVRAAIDVLARCSPPTAAVLGDMGEVGDRGPEFHAEIGTYARDAGIGSLYGIGTLMRHAVAAFGEHGREAQSMEELLALVVPLDRPGATLLVKGSRFMRMERVVDALVASSPAARGMH
jgi:UDP-N-acetylmuramoyl-tripeptide--D-alanyl-D-alanine ligase